MTTCTEAQVDVYYVRACTCDNFLPSLKELPEKANKMFLSSKPKANNGFVKTIHANYMADEKC